MSPQITLHHLNASRSDRIFWVLEELGLPYDVKVHFRLPTRAAPDSLKKVSPLGKSPAVLLDNKVLTESAFIVHTLLKQAEVQQKAKDGELDVEVEETDDTVFWSHFAEGSMMNLFQAGAIVSATGGAWASGKVGGLSQEEATGVGKYTKWATESYLNPQIQDTIDFAESFITDKGHKYFSGTSKPGEGDFMMYFAINSLLTGTRKDAGYKVGQGLRGWHERVMSRPAAKKAAQRLADEEEKAKSKM
ncbi:hypothetical protein IAU60_001546 [Kwoniella sp. DSM 27419]